MRSDKEAVSGAVTSADKDLQTFFAGEPPGQKTNAIRWLQKQVMRNGRLRLPHDFPTRRRGKPSARRCAPTLPAAIGVPGLSCPGREPGAGAHRVGEDVICERVDVYVDDDCAFPGFVFSAARGRRRRIAGRWCGRAVGRRTSGQVDTRRFAVRDGSAGICRADPRPRPLWRNDASHGQQTHAGR